MSDLSRKEMALILAHKAMSERTFALTGSQIAALWSRLLHATEEQFVAFGRLAAALTNVAKGRIAHAEDAFYARFIAATLNVPERPLGIDPSVLTTEALRGISDDELWHRPAATYFTALSEGHEPEEALRRGGYRAGEIVDSQLVAARTKAAEVLLPKRAEVNGYARLPGRKSCALCQAAGIRLYERQERMPTHLHCKCAIVPSLRRRPTPPLVKAGDALAALPPTREEEIASVGGLLDVVQVSNHGELGPQLTWADQQFTGPGSLE